MTAQKPDRSASRVFAGPVAMILSLIAIFWLLADWENVPKLLSATFGTAY